MIFATLLAATIHAGVIPADLIRIKDGDTLVVRAHLMPDMTRELTVRLADLDTPEKSCPGDHARAAENLRGWIVPGAQLMLHDLRVGSFGRWRARVTVNTTVTITGTDLSEQQKRDRQGWAYDRDRRGTCPAQNTAPGN